MEGGSLAMSQKERSRLVVMSKGEGADNDCKGGIGDGGGKLPAMPADIQTICEGGG